MNKWNLWKRKWHLPVLGITLLILGYLAWALFTISYKADFFAWMALGVTIAAMVCFGWITCSCAKFECGNGVRNQWRAVCGIIAVCSTLLIFRGGNDLWREQDFPCLVIEVLWCVIGGCSFCLLLDRNSFSAVKIKNFFKVHKGILALLAITCILCIEPNAFQYRWDGILYYLTCKELSLRSMSSLAIYGHIAQTFGTLVQMGNIIFQDTGISLIAVNVTLMMLSIIYFYAILTHCLPGRGQGGYVLLTAIYAWSPYLLGMVPYYNLDFACQCLAVPVIYYLMRKRWILFAFFSILFCFTKEPAILVYGAFCTGSLLVDVVEDKGLTLGERVRRCFGRAQYYIMAMPGILWLVTYEILGPWSAGNGGVDYNISYVVDKLKNLYILNFNWIFTLVIAVGIIMALWRKDQELGKLIFPLICAQAVFTAFSCLFKTVNHPRYNDMNQVTLYLIAIILICTYIKQAVYGIWGIVMSFLLLVSSFYTIDPVSLFVYPAYRIGSATMVTTGDSPLGDFMIYNRQMLGMERALGRAVNASVQDDVMVCFPAINNNPYYFDGMSAVSTLAECRFDTEYWDTERCLRVPERGENTIEFTVCQIPEQAEWTSIETTLDDQADLIYMDCAGRQCYEEMKEYYSVVQEEEYNYKGWTVHRVRFQKE